ncbi:Quinol oxidase subunit 1 [compost metagenome]
MYKYSESTGFGPLNLIASIGAVGLAIGFAILVYNIYWSFRYAPRDTTGDPWNARTLEWSTHSPVPEYNFAIVPEVKELDPFWEAKKKGKSLFKGDIEEIHMPNNSGQPFILGMIFFVFGFAMVFTWWVPAVLGGVGIIVMLAVRSFERDHGRHIPVKEIVKTEAKLRGEGV